MTTSTITRADAAEEILKRRRARANLIDFCKYTFSSYEAAPHCLKIAEKLEAVERGEIKRLMIFLPPRHSKSEHVSRRFPAWYLGRNPQKGIIATSYSDALAHSNSWSVREIIRAESYQRLWSLSFDVEGLERWTLSGKENKRPSYIAAGVGGGITGEGADILIIDDPLKNDEEAASQLIRDKQWDWYTSVARTRLQPGASVVLTMTRWHTDDLAGRLLKQQIENPEADKWEVIHLPAEKDGEALWASHYPIEALQAIKATIGSRKYTAMYLGSPTEAQGNIFRREWWKYYKTRPVFKRVIQSWDTAFKQGGENDYSVCELWGETDTGYYLIDVWRDRVEFPELKKAVIAAYNRDHPGYVIVEDAASGQSLIQELKRETSIPVKPIKIDRDKVARSNAVTPLIESGRVFLPEYAPWLFNYIEELSAFPNGDHDDQVDATTQALSYLAGKIEYTVSFV